MTTHEDYVAALLSDFRHLTPFAIKDMLLKYNVIFELFGETYKIQKAISIHGLHYNVGDIITLNNDNVIKWSR